MKITLHRDGNFTVNRQLMGQWHRSISARVPWWARCHCSKVIDAYYREGFINNLERHMTNVHPTVFAADVEVGSRDA